MSNVLGHSWPVAGAGVDADIDSKNNAMLSNAIDERNKL